MTKKKCLTINRMKIKYLSDLHLEKKSLVYAKECVRNISKCDVLALVGDIGNPRDDNYRYFLESINKKFPKTYLVAGNHEYYNYKTNYTDVYSDYNTSINSLKTNLPNPIINTNCPIETVNGEIASFVESLDNVEFLNNNHTTHNGVIFHGSTLWSHIVDNQLSLMC